MRRTTVAIDRLVEVPAYVSDETWNGWAMPYFDAKDVHLIQDSLNAIGEGDVITYDADDDAYVVTSGDFEERYHGVDVDGMHLYPIGSGAWIWAE